MSDKPLRSKITIDGLIDYAHQLNSMGFTKGLAWRWSVANRTLPNGQTQHFLHRYDVREETRGSIGPDQSQFGGVHDHAQMREYDGF